MINSNEQYLSFILQEELYGIELFSVKELIRIPDVSRIPGMPDYVKGVINLRSKIIPVIDLRLRFGLVEKAYNDRTSVIIVEIPKDNEMQLCGFVADTAKEVLKISSENISPPDCLQLDGIEYLKGIGNVDGDLIRLLNADRIIAPDEQELLIQEASINNQRRSDYV
jgi:purine-binding chemotaxis protein CheW